jgi:glycosyltransferase involved in cell wall biosynthesis
MSISTVTPLTVLRSSPASRPEWRQVGGGRRAMQITEVLAAHGITSVSSDDIVVPSCGRLKRLRIAWQLRRGEPTIKFRADRSIVRHLVNDYLRHREFFAANPAIRVMLVENCTDYAQIRAARDSGVGLVALPANFEVWQVPAQTDFYSGEPMPASLHREAGFTALCDEVFCISREEAWYLANYGARVDFLPYFPPAEDLAALQVIRQRRTTQASGSELLTVTAVSNLKNRNALIALAALVRQLPAGEFHLHVGGRGTEALRDHFPADRCTFHGEIADADLADLMTRCRAAIVYQPSGVGALTRIPEILCAGVPILANPHAARSAYGTAGVNLFHDAAELLAMARQPLPMPPAPQPDTAAGDRLAAAIRALAARPSAGH